MPEHIRILFNRYGDVDNYNSQALTAREIALRLNPERFRCAFFVRNRADPRLVQADHISLLPLPRRLSSIVMAHHMIWGKYDILFYPMPDRATQVFWRFHHLGSQKKVIGTVEVSAAQLTAVPSFKRQLALFNIQRADACFACSNYVSESIEQVYGIELPVIHLGVDTRLFRSSVCRSNNDSVRVIDVASIQPRKQTHLVLQLSRRLRNTPAEFHLVGGVIGDPAYRECLVKECVEEGLDNVFFHGTMPQTEVRDLMAKSDIFVLPSHLEGLPKVTLEAAATGLPVVVFEDYHTPSVVDGVTGFQVQTFEEMLDRLRLLIEDRDLRLRMGAAAVEHVKQFDWDVVVKRWEQVFREVVGVDL